MYPQQRLSVYRRYSAESLAKASDIFTVAKSVVEKAREEDEKTDSEQKAVDKVHESDR